jgi:hypothetical protein
MANNIQIVGQVLNTDVVNRYTLQDEQLLIPTLLQETFGQSNDYIEYFVFDIGGNVLNSSYNYLDYKLPPQSAYTQSLLPDLQIDPIQDIQNLGYESGEVTTRYNFFRKISGEPFNNNLFIQQISSDRTEIRVSSTVLSDIELLAITTNFNNKQNSVPYYYYIILNFGDNNQVIAVNILSSVTDNGEVSILFKLYQPLPANINLKDTFWIVEEIVNPYIFDLNLDKLITPLPQPALKGPNFDIDLEIKNVVPTPYNNYYQLISSLTGSAYQTVLNSIGNQQTNINIDYSVLNDFVHFSSAENRLSNFVYKIGEIETYQAEINYNTPLTSSNTLLANSVNRASSSINEIITTFDGFESYLYFNSSSLTSSIVEYTLETGSFLEYNIASYPKSNSTQPYTLYASSSVQVQNWYATASNVAVAFDIDNKDILIDVIPSYIKEDPDNYYPYIIFVNMIGQYFDNIWIYIDKLTDVWDNNNNINEGISKDLVYDWLQSFGVKLYNSQGNQDVLDYNVGGLSGSVVFNSDYSPSSSFLNNVSRKDLVQDTYKRIYHNLPYLFKAKGSHGGLQGLITLFGITGSILPIKEYGGMTDYQDLKGYTTDKITLGTNTITGSVLSSIKRLETTTTSSREIKSQDLHFIDVSFSPQTQIDAAVSASITAVDPTWNLDDYIGNPTYLQLNTYPSLSYQREYWFGQTFDQTFDYGGFIRLIQFFDNSLFKMIKDFTPARSNTWTGVTIKSPVLERPKVAQYNPIFINETEPEGEVTGAAILPVYDPYYFFLAGDKEPYYEGNISGSFIDTYAYFQENNINPYLVNNTIGYIPPGFVSGNTDFILDYNAPRYENFFLNSDFNVLQNNVDLNLESQYRKKLTPILSTDALGRTFTSYSVLEPVELQDSYLSLTSYTNPRYDGVQLYGQAFNTWTRGDVSYGQSPVINYNVKKLGLFTEIVDNIYLPNKSTVNLKYLVDEAGRLTELNQRNRNWVEVQNTFKTGDFLNISLFDSQKYSNQRFTNGNKIIYESGYSYAPVFYSFGNETASLQIIPTTQSIFLAPEGESQNVLNTYFFLSSSAAGNPIISGGIASTQSGSRFVSSSATNVYPSGNMFEVWNLWNITGSNSVPGDYFYPGVGPGTGNSITSSYYVIPNKSNYQFSYDFDVVLNVSASNVSYVTTSMEIWKYTTASAFAVSSALDTNYNVSSFQGLQYRAVLGNIATGYSNIITRRTGITQKIDAGISIFEYNTQFSTTPIQILNYPTDQIYEQIEFYVSIIDRSGGGNFRPAPVPINDGETLRIGEQRINLGTFWVNQNDLNALPFYIYGVKKYSVLQQVSSNSFTDQIVKFRHTVNVDLNNISVGDRIAFRFFIGNNDGNTKIEYANVVSDGYLKVVPSQGSIVTKDTQVCFDQQSNAFFLNEGLSQFFGPLYFFDPLNANVTASVTSSYQNLYNQYGEINYPFVLEPNDKIVIQAIDSNGPTLEYTVSNVQFLGSQSLAYIYVREDIDGYFNACSKFHKILFLKRLVDETSVILNFNKPEGKTSYGFSISENISPAVINNIDIITKNVNQQLVDVGISSI